jgi:hypothetical protein
MQELRLRVRNSCGEPRGTLTNPLLECQKVSG